MTYFFTSYLYVAKIIFIFFGALFFFFDMKFLSITTSFLFGLMAYLTQEKIFKKKKVAPTYIIIAPRFEFYKTYKKENSILKRFNETRKKTLRLSLLGTSIIKKKYTIVFYRILEELTLFFCFLNLLGYLSGDFIFIDFVIMSILLGLYCYSFFMIRRQAMFI